MPTASPRLAERSFTELLSTLDTRDTVVVCATSRLAQTLRLRHTQANVHANLRQWKPLKALTFDQWMDEIQTLVALQGWGVDPAFQALPLTSLQERVLWERVIRQNLGEGQKYLFDVVSLAKSAMDAHELNLVWKVRPQAHLLTEESRRFLQWQQAFLDHNQREGWVDKTTLRLALMTALEPHFGSLRMPARVAFAGFTRLNPLEQSLQSLLQAQGVEVVTVQTNADLGTPKTQTLSYPDTASEALAAALWVQSTWHKHPDAALAIVVPDLAQQRQLLQDTLDDVLAPQTIGPSQAQNPRPYNISLGLPLRQYPLVQVALSILDLLCDPAHIEQVALGRLLRSPYWSAGVSEADARALWDAHWRKCLAPTTDLALCVDDLKRRADNDRAGNPAPAQLLWHLGHWAALHASLQNARLPSDWAQALPQVLQQAGWLHERKLTSAEYQTKEAFLGVVAGLAQLDDGLSAVDVRQAVSVLRRCCQDHVFQPQTEGEPKLQVLGLLETSGLTFDGVWVMGMNDTAWPPAARPNALLPSELQRHQQSPNASASVQLAFAQALQSHLQSCAPQVTFSWARRNGDAELSPSPLIPLTSKANHQPAPASPHWSQAVLQAPNDRLADPMEDAMAPAVGQGERVGGGTWMLRAQAICPAWAFYQYRLGAGKLEEPVDGLDPRKRGTLVHHALEKFWETVKSSKALHDLGEAGRLAQVEHAVDAVLTEFTQDQRNPALKPRFLQLERSRLVRLLMQWLALELAREQAFTVIHLEKASKPDIEGFQMRMFIDRIDQLEDGSTLVIDYKTGKSIDFKNWSSQRLTEPQLPIYASIDPPAEGPVRGVVFAKVLMNDPAWAGLAQQDKLLPGVTGWDSKAGRKLFPEDRFAHWDGILHHWRDRIQAVAKEVKTGEAGVRFDDERLLKHCDVLPLLRLAERRAQLEAALAAPQQQPSGEEQ